MDNPDIQSESIKIEPSKSPAVGISLIPLQKEIRSWAIALLGWGILSIVLSGYLSAAWGILLIFVGLASFYFRSSAMLVVYGVTMAWAGVHNLMGGQTFWIAFAFFQWFLTFRVFQQFFRFRRTENNLGKEESDASTLTPERTAKVFPWAAGALGLFTLFGFIGNFIAIILFDVISGSKTVPVFFIITELMMVNFAVLSFAIGLAAVLCKYPKKGLSICGMVTGFVTVLIHIVLIYL